MAKVLAWRTGNLREHEVETDLAISAKARALGLRSLDDLKLAVLRQRPTWWAGSAYHCPLCDADFTTPQRAAEHVVLEQHPVLRMD
jgi:hypothetical protein